MAEVLLGDNPFFGIDHLSQERARKRGEAGFERIAEIMEYAAGRGVRRFTASTHPRLAKLVGYLKGAGRLRMELCPVLPYAQGYVELATEKGAMGAVRQVLSGAGARAGIGVALGASAAYLRGDAARMVRALVDAELGQVREARCQTAFLHDVVTDACLGLGLEGVIRTYAEHVRDRHGLRAGVVTKNFPLLAERLESRGIGGVSVMASFNPAGFQMNPSKEACEAALRRAGPELIAMNALAGGFLGPDEAARYVSGLGIGAVAVGMSTLEHAAQTLDAFGAP